MRIKEITSESRNDFCAVMACEHCGATQNLTSGYHDNHYHTRVIPAMVCKSCGRNREGTVDHPSGLSGEHDAVLDATHQECLHGRE